MEWRPELPHIRHIKKTQHETKTVKQEQLQFFQL